MLHGVDMEVTVELGRTRMTVRELLALSPGHRARARPGRRQPRRPARQRAPDRPRRGRRASTRTSASASPRSSTTAAAELTMLELDVRLIVSLAVVVGLLLLLAKVSGRRMRGRAGSLVQVVHRQPLSRLVRRRRRHRRLPGARPGHHRAAGDRPHRARPRRAGPDLVLVPGEADEDGEPTTVPVLLPPTPIGAHVQPAVETALQPVQPASAVAPARRSRPVPAPARP